MFYFYRQPFAFQRSTLGPASTTHLASALLVHVFPLTLMSHTRIAFQLNTSNLSTARHLDPFDIESQDHVLSSRLGLEGREHIYVRNL